MPEDDQSGGGAPKSSVRERVKGVAGAAGAVLGFFGAASARVAADDETVVLTVACAIAEADDEEWKELGARDRKRYRRLARAALEAFAKLTGDGIRTAAQQAWGGKEG